MANKKYFLIAGERSGDLHGGNLVNAIKNLDETAIIKGFGGDYMHNNGMELVSHYKEISFMGFLEVLKNLKQILNKLKYCKKAIATFRPDVLILIDFPGFNLKIAKYASTLGIPVFYYISPKIWAWKESRIKSIKKYVNKMFVIFPFEVSYYQKHDYNVKFVGNPLIEYIREFNFNEINIEKASFEKIIAYLPGSREQEIKSSINMIYELSNLKSNWLFLVAAVDNVPENLYDSISKSSNVKIIFNRTYDVLKLADASVTTSGTATLETAIIGVPQLVCYKTSRLTYWIGKQLVKINYISLVNLVMDKPVVKELIQEDYNVEYIINELNELLYNNSYIQSLQDDYKILIDKLTKKSSSEEVAQYIRNYLSRL